MISCCFCDRIIPEDDVYVLSLNYPDETDQEWVCHRNCFRAALHPDYRYFDDEELDEARFPSTHLRAECAHGRVEVWAVEEGHVKWWCRSCGEEREFTKATWPYEWEKLNDLFLCYDCHLFLEGETLND